MSLDSIAAHSSSERLSPTISLHSARRSSSTAIFISDYLFVGNERKVVNTSIVHHFAALFIHFLQRGEKGSVLESRSFSSAVLQFALAPKVGLWAHRLSGKLCFGAWGWKAGMLTPGVNSAPAAPSPRRRRRAASITRPVFRFLFAAPAAFSDRPTGLLPEKPISLSCPAGAVRAFGGGTFLSAADGLIFPQPAPPPQPRGQYPLAVAWVLRSSPPYLTEPSWSGFSRPRPLRSGAASLPRPVPVVWRKK